MGECTEKESSLLNFSGRPLQLVYCSDCAWESSPEMNCCQLQWLLCLGSPSRNPHPSQIQVIIKWPVQPSALLHKKHRQKRVYDAWVCVQQLRLDHKIAVCCPSPSCFPFMASSLLSACILQGLTTFSGSAHVIVCKPSYMHFCPMLSIKAYPGLYKSYYISPYTTFLYYYWGFVNTGSTDWNEKHSSFNGYLDCLSMVPENIHSYNCFVEFWIGWLHQLIVKMFLSIITDT